MTNVSDASQTPIVPPKWKLAVLTWLAIFPAVSTFIFASEPIIGGFHLIARVFISTLIIVPLMTWVIMPNMIKLFRRWLLVA